MSNTSVDEKQLDREEQTRLFQEYKKTRDRKIRDKLIEDNLYIAEILAKKYTNKGIDYDDIFQVASIGLIYAVDRFDVDRGYQFSSFATPTIIGEIKRHFRDKGWTIRVPRRIQELSKRINNAKVELAQTLQKSPTVKDIADYLGTSQEDVLEAMEASKVYSPQSLDLTYDGGEDSDISLADLIGKEEEYYEKIDNNDFLEKAMSILTETEKKILIDRYFNKRTQSSIAKELDISQMTVSRLEKKILEKMKNEIKK
ncbi:MAG: SigB/SigF/SigG family RNA polymerase sigma factor, partial [Tissierellia bacterium]|nr:SigB/SigF/SigG family RNA polymerase sigma factor [Tissierellia bacterium]